MSTESLSGNQLNDIVKNLTSPNQQETTRQNLLLSVFAFLEVALIFLSGLMLAKIYVSNILGEVDYFQSYLTPLALTPVLTIIVLRCEGLYQRAAILHFKDCFDKIIKSYTIIFGTLILLGFFVGITGAYSRVWFICWALASIMGSMGLRWGMGYAMRNITPRNLPLKRVAIYGDTIPAYRIKASIEAHGNSTQIIGIFSDTEKNPQSKNIMGSMADLIALGKQVPIDQIILAREVAERFEMTQLISELSTLSSEVLIYPNFLGEMMDVSGVQSCSSTRLIRVQKRPISEFGLLFKSLIDKIVAIIALIVLSPVMLLTAIAIKLDSKGPILFKQKRNGYNQKEIFVYKFRTMKVMEEGNEVRQAEKNDHRITRIGTLLRKTSIDELPQLINVLKGEMSIVGPRPHPVALNFDYSTRMMRYDNRHKVKPGMTGWAQVNGYRGPTDTPDKMRKRIEYDLEYIGNWSIWFDLKIILATPFYGLVGKNAF